MKKKTKKGIFFTDKRLEIGRILIDELTMWKSTTAVSTQEFMKLVERLEKLFTPTK